MTPPDSPSALLERAAALIEQRVAAIPAFGGMHGVDGNEAWTEWLNMFIVDPDPVALFHVTALREAAHVYATLEPQFKPGSNLDHLAGRVPSAALAFARHIIEETQ